MPVDETPAGEDLTYIRYSAKEILFHLTSKVEALQSDVNAIKTSMVSREELTGARRWAVTATITSAGSLIALFKLVG